MENMKRIHDCCGDDYSHGTFGHMVRNIIREITKLESLVSIGLTLAMGLIVYRLLKSFQSISHGSWVLSLYTMDNREMNREMKVLKLSIFAQKKPNVYLVSHEFVIIPINWDDFQ